MRSCKKLSSTKANDNSGTVSERVTPCIKSEIIGIFKNSFNREYATAYWHPPNTPLIACMHIVVTQQRNVIGDMLAILTFLKAALLVHRYYGGTRRLSEREKRQLETIIAMRTQCTKDVWKRNIEKTKRELEEARTTARAGEAQLTAGLAALLDAVSQQQREFDAEPRRTGSSLLDIGDRRVAPGQSDQQGRPESGAASTTDDRGGFRPSSSSLTDVAEKVRRLTEYWVRERSQMREERARALSLLGVRDAPAAPRLDVEVHRLHTQLSAANERASNAEKRAELMLEEYAYTAKNEDDVKAKDRVINKLTSDLKRAEREADVAHAETKNLAKQLQLMKIELDRYVVRFRCMEKVSNPIFRLLAIVQRSHFLQKSLELSYFSFE